LAIRQSRLFFCRAARLVAVQPAIIGPVVNLTLLWVFVGWNSTKAHHCYGSLNKIVLKQRISSGMVGGTRVADTLSPKPGTLEGRSLTQSFHQLTVMWQVIGVRYGS